MRVLGDHSSKNTYKGIEKIQNSICKIDIRSNQRHKQHDSVSRIRKVTVNNKYRNTNI